uniref:Uncharacterized protein n=1 Tax=Meloidogyne enterolobii TaxID=390850 RepID=A0A6V7WI47_MELEN|nr:unnamed protein product [Meloidogyne enterolobii]
MCTIDEVIFLLSKIKQNYKINQYSIQEGFAVSAFVFRRIFIFFWFFTFRLLKSFSAHPC